jgi:DNA-binding NtrC family response regulator
MNNEAVVLVMIGENPEKLQFLSGALAQPGLTIFTAGGAERGIQIVYREHPQIVLADFANRTCNGLRMLEQIVEFDPAIDVVLMTPHYSSESAMEAIRKGASDYLKKPVLVSRLRDNIASLIEHARRSGRLAALENGWRDAAQFEGMIGRSPAMRDMFARIRRVGPHFRTVLLTGRTGTQKELVARALHKLSPVSTGAFAVLNCPALIETLFDSELFGHVAGSFTAAHGDKFGLFEFADQGILFLNEIGDMPLKAQATLLDAVQNQQALRPGSDIPRKVDVRVIAATHQDLRDAVARNLFREDLFCRLSAVEIRIPPLEERKEDIPLLINHFLEKFSTRLGKKVTGVTQRAQAVLARHSWPGDIQELENVVEHACSMALGERIDVRDLPGYLRVTGSDSPVTITQESTSFEQHERRLISEALARAEGNQSKAARELRIGRDALRYKMKRHGFL